VIVGLGGYFSSSGAVSLPRELDPLFRSEVLKQPIRIGRTEHLAGLEAATWRFKADAHARIGRLGHLAGLGAVTWHFKANACARFVDHQLTVRAPSRPAKPQSTGGEQRRYRQEQMFCLHGLLLFDSSFTFTFATPLCADFRELAFDLERRPIILVRTARKKE
jgi:hypothetical protein